MPSDTDLPSSVAKIAKIIGRELALALAGNCKNGRLYIPRSIGRNHWIAKLIGIQPAERLAKHRGGEILYLATCHELKIKFRNQAIHRWAAEGHTRRELADLTGLTERQVINILAEKSEPIDARKPAGMVVA